MHLTARGHLCTLITVPFFYRKSHTMYAFDNLQNKKLDLLTRNSIIHESFLQLYFATFFKLSLAQPKKIYFSAATYITRLKYKVFSLGRL